MAYKRKEYIADIENQTKWHLGYQSVFSLIDQLRHDGRVIIPIQQVSYANLSGDVRIVHGPDSDLYSFGMDNGGAASPYTSYDPAIVNFNDYDFDPEIYDPDSTAYHHLLADYSTTINNKSTTYAIPSKASNAQVYTLGDPVDMVKGEFYTEENPDFRIKSRGFELSVIRKYKSRLIYNGPFGFGWTWNHAERIMPLDNDGIIYHNNDGVSFEITYENSEYVYPKGSRFQLKKLTDGYKITQNHSRIKSFFSSKGYLIRKEDPYGNILEYEYTNPVFTNRITKIKDALGRYLDLHHNANGKVEKITDFTGRSCNYGYGPHDDPDNPDRKDNLVTFTDLEGYLTEYHYLYGQENEFNNHNMSKYILPNGDWLEIGYYRNDQAAYHTNKKGETFHFMYSRLNRYAETWNEEGYYRKVFFNESNDVTRILNEDGTVERMAYDVYHNKIHHTDANGYTTHFTYCPDKADESPCLPDLETGEYSESDDGVTAAKRNLYTKTNELGERWEYKYESSNNAYAPTEVKDPEERVVGYSYTSEGRLDIKTQGPELSVTSDGEIVTVTGLETNYDYDGYGNLTKVTYPDNTTNQKFYHVTGGRHPDGLYLLYELDGKGKKTTYDYYDLNDPDGILVGPDTVDTQGMPVKGMPVSTLKSVEIDSEPDDITTYYKYNHYNQVTEVTDAIGGITRYEYDENRQLERKINANGAVTTHEYYSARDIVSGAKVKKIIDPLLNSEYFEYDQLGNVILKEDRNGNITRYIYDEMNRLSEEIDPFRNSIHYTYDGNGNLVSKIDKNGNESFFEYDAANRLLIKTDPAGQTTVYEYYRDGKIKNEKYTVNTINPISVVTHYKYDALGRLESETIGDDTTNGYDPSNCTDCRISQYRYDALGRLKKTIFPLGNYEVNEYDGNGNKTKVTNYDRNEVQLRQTDYIYYPDSRNLLKEVVVDNGIDGLPGTGDGHLYEYDALGRTVTEIDPEGNMVEYVYDSVGNLLFEIDAVGNITEYIYDDANRKVQTIDAENNKMIFRYDDTGNLISAIDREGNETLTFYDALNRRSGIQDPSGALTSYDYDGNGNLVTVVDPNGGVTDYEYDGINRLTRKVRPLGEETTYAYDPVGNQTEITDEKNQKITYEYDRYRFLKEAKYYNAADHTNPVRTVNFLYDDNGNMKYFSDGSVSASYTYDDLSRKLSETVTYSTFSKGFSYTYPSYWQKTFSGPDGAIVTYDYDAAMRLSEIDIPGAGKVTVNDYHGFATKEVSLPGGTRTYTYDPLMRVKTILSEDLSGSEVMRRDYTYSLEGNIEQNATEHGTYTYDYDDMYRLTGAVNPTLVDEGYTFDDLGNRLTSDAVAGSWDYNLNNELQGYDATTFDHDDNGNMTNKNQAGRNMRYIYDGADRLVEVMENGVTIATYYYDPFGRRLWKRVDGVKTYFLYSDEGLIGEYDENGAEIRSYGYTFGSQWTTNPLFVKTAGTYYWYQNDHLGTPQKITRTDGSVAWAAEYDSFGNVLITTEDISNNLRFAGQYYDAESGLHYNWHRYYDPEIGRYLRVDPQGDGLNLYAYVYNNPLSYVDPEGLIARAAWDATTDFYSQHSNTINSSLRIAGGLAEAVAGYTLGAVLSPTVAGGIAGAAIGTHGVDQIISGIRSLGHGDQVNAYSSQLMQAAGVQRETANMINDYASDALLLAVGVVNVRSVASPVVTTTTNAPKKTLYHYTTEAGEQGILKSGVLNASQGAKNARHGAGQYFTDIAPEAIGGATKATTEAGKLSLGQLSSRLFKVPWNSRKVTNYVEVDVTNLPVQQVAPNIFLNKTDTALDITNKIVRSGSTLP